MEKFSSKRMQSAREDHELQTVHTGFRSPTSAEAIAAIQHRDVQKPAVDVYLGDFSRYRYKLNQYKTNNCTIKNNTGYARGVT